MISLSCSLGGSFRLMLMLALRLKLADARSTSTLTLTRFSGVGKTPGGAALLLSSTGKGKGLVMLGSAINTGSDDRRACNKSITVLEAAVCLSLQQVNHSG